MRGFDPRGREALFPLRRVDGRIIRGHGGWGKWS